MTRRILIPIPKRYKFSCRIFVYLNVSRKIGIHFPSGNYVFRDLKCDEGFKICIRSHQALGIASCGQELAGIVRRRINKNENRENDRPYSRGQINFAKHQRTINVGNLRVPGLLKTWHESRKYFPFHRHAFIWSLCDHTASATFTFRNACITSVADENTTLHHVAPRRRRNITRLGAYLVANGKFVVRSYTFATIFSLCSYIRISSVREVILDLMSDKKDEKKFIETAKIRSSYNGIR